MILVTAATGQVGSQLVRLLSAQGVACRALVRRDVARLDLPGVEQVTGDFRDAASLEAAMAGVSRVYLACAPTPEQPELEGRAIEAARRSGVGHVVKLSAYDARDDNASDFRRWNGIAERRLRDAGLAWTVLRPTAFCQSVDAAAIARKGELLSPQGEAATPFIDVRDIAAVAAAALTGAGHEGRIYDLTGPRTWTQDEVARRIARAFRTPVACRHVGDAEAYAGLIAAGMDEGFARSMIAHWQAYRAHPATLLSGWVELLTGRPPRGLEAWIAECATAAGIG